MAKPKIVTYFKTVLEDRPGALLAFAKELKSKDLGLLALWGFGTQPGRGELYCIPKNPEKFRKAQTPSGMPMEEGMGLFLKGPDKTGALLKTLETIAEEGVNIVAIHAIATGGNFGSFVRVGSADLEKTAKTLGAK